MRYLLYILTVLLSCSAIYAQTPSDSTHSTTPEPLYTTDRPTETLLYKDTIPPKWTKKQTTAPIVQKKVDKKPFVPNSKKALLYSIVPGGGQIYNRKYWKLPIIAGAYTVCYYAISWNNNNLQEYAKAYRDLMSDDPTKNTSWHRFLPYGADPATYLNNTNLQNRLKRGRDFYRRNRDFSIIISALSYALCMIDAYVDAELASFDISPSLTLSPTIAPINIGGYPSANYGLTLAYTF